MAKTDFSSSTNDSTSDKSTAEQILPPIATFPGSDSSSWSITSHKLDGKNYLQWAQSVKIVICARGKLGYITGELPTPKSTDSSYKTWQVENSMVLAWLINSMEPQISRRYLWFKTAKDVWDDARRMYSDLGNASQIFEIRSKLKEMKQGSKTITQYFSDLQELWQELDLFFEEEVTCAECSVKQRKNLEKERVFDFLAGLNRDLDDVRGRVVARDPFPSTEDAFAEVRHEEVRRKVMLLDNTPAIPTVSESSALVSHKHMPYGKPKFEQKSSTRPKCEYCHYPGHTQDTCPELHGKPPNWQPKKKKDSKAYHTQSAAEPATGAMPLTNEQLEQICKFLSQSSVTSQAQSSSTIGSCSMAQSGSTIGDDDWQC